jgi:hypothetical protein
VKSELEMMADDLSNRMDDLVHGILKNRMIILEGFVKEYLQETGFKPSEIELVETRGQNYGAISWSFQKKQPKAFVSETYRQVEESLGMKSG